ncbi:ATP-binding protein [Paraoerskovia marina]|uniref:Histidine kinase-like ATPase domain-containing protein n=1 Tax=Paraoerskovia marina TaxID=545619 RepID=A0A1H1MBH9_9CELL|nr:ATP-binding protein [Paraoerskovia marina]SDR84020.1 Histidine kinase-like ATPase domain-containing protein [Paraoerskovia marina]
MGEAIHTGPAPDGFRTERSWTISRVEDLGRLRRGLHRALAGCCTSESIDHLVLVANELATNALRHGSTPAIVRLMSNENEYLLEVIDRAVDAHPVVAGPRPAGQGGFGLLLARRLAEDVGFYTTPFAKHVWARFPVTSAARSVAAAG